MDAFCFGPLKKNSQRAPSVGGMLEVPGGFGGPFDAKKKREMPCGMMHVMILRVKLSAQFVIKP
jgi:hypothetical protein